MRHEIKKSPPVTLVIGGLDYPMTRPKMGALMDLDERIDEAKAKGKGSAKVMGEFVVACGLPAEVVRELDTEELEAVILALTPKKN